jgi:hypothetical protein
MKKPILITALLLSIIVTSCKTTIPANDSIIPTLTVALTGDGVDLSDLTIDDIEFDTKAFYLKRNTEYTILFSGKDAGGVKKVTWEFPKNNVEVLNPISSNWSEDLETATLRSLKSEGNPMDPRSSILFSNDLIFRNQTSGSTESIEFNYTVTDFRDNVLTKTLIIIIGAGPTQVGPR